MQNHRLVFMIGVAIAVWFATSSYAICSELRVVESTVPGIKKDAIYPDSAAFDVPLGKKIKFLKKPENTTHEIFGPYKGVLSDYRSGCSWRSWIRGKCDRNSDAEGGTRSISPALGKTDKPQPPMQ